MPRKDPAAQRAYQRAYKALPAVKEKRRAYDAANREKRNAARRQWRAENPEKESATERRKKYGTCGTELLEKQNGLCAICSTDLGKLKTRAQHIDHCHVTGRVRGWLCISCNTAIGMLRDDPALCLSAAKYLTEKGK